VQLHANYTQSSLIKASKTDNIKSGLTEIMYT